jgi:KaiC/GvpD/RAD55 family RecA-like ATPase
VYALDLQLLGDIFTSLGGVLPFLVIMRLARRLGRGAGLNIPWWLFPIGWIGFGGHVATLLAERLGYIVAGPVSIYYSTLSRAVMGIIAALGMTSILIRVGLRPSIPVKIYLPLIAVGPAIASAYQRVSGHNPIIQDPLPAQILYQGFIFWMLLSYSSLLLSRLERRLGAGSGFLPLSGSLLHGVVGGIFLYVASSYLYSVFSLTEYNTWRGVVPIAGSVAGIAMLIASLRMDVTLISPKTKYHESITSGVTEIDDETGGLPHLGSMLIMGPSGSGKTSIINKLSATRLKDGDSIALFCLDYDAQKVRKNLNRLGVNVGECEKNNRLILVEGYLQLSGIKPEEKFTTSRDLTDISINISKALSLLPGPRKWIIIDSVTHILNESGAERTLNFLRTTLAKTVKAAAGLIVTINHETLTPVDAALIQDLFHGLVETDVIEEGKRLMRRLRIVKMLGVQCSGKWRYIS